MDEIGWRVGYEDPAFFGRLFKRIFTGVSPADYRRQFQIRHSLPGPGGRNNVAVCSRLAT